MNHTPAGDLARAAELRRIEQRLRVDAETCYQQGTAALDIRADAGSVLGDYQRDTYRHWCAMAHTAEFYADEAASRAADLEAHAADDALVA